MLVQGEHATEHVFWLLRRDVRSKEPCPERILSGLKLQELRTVAWCMDVQKQGWQSEMLSSQARLSQVRVGKGGG